MKRHRCMELSGNEIDNGIVVHPSKWLIQTAKNYPSVVIHALRVLSRVFPRGDEHWILPALACAANARITVLGRLGNGMRMRLVWTDGVSQSIRRQGFFEPETVAVVRSVIKPGDHFWDVGAQLGQYTLLACGLGAEVHAFEPDPATFSLLAENVKSNSLSAVRLNCFAITEHCGTVQFYMAPPTNIGASSCQKTDDGFRVEVECHTLDCYAEQHQLPQLVKLDVEGSEISVLLGAKRLLARQTPLIVEFSPRRQSCAELATLLRGHGYRLERLSAKGPEPYVPIPGEYRVFNVLAVGV